MTPNAKYSNPILYADYSDPDAIRVGADYFMIASSFCNTPGIPILHSKDMVHWKVVNYVLDAVPEAKYEAPIHGCGVWAPSLRYHDGVYYACFPMPDEGIYMSTATDPFGKWSAPVNIRPGAGWIDPCPFWDEDGKAYLVAGVAKSRIGYKSVLHMVEMQADGMGLIGEERVVFDGNTNDQVTLEGPKLYKRNGYYYIFAPAGGVKVGWQTVLRSKNIWGPYEYKVVMRQGDSPVNGPHQGAWIDTVKGEDYFLHFQDVYAAGRIIHLQPMHWENDWPIIGIAKPGCDYGEPVMEYDMPDVGEVPTEYQKIEPACNDDFSQETLGLQWQWNANGKKEFYELADGCLRLKAVVRPMVQTEVAACAKDCPYGDLPNLLLQKWPAAEFSCVTELDLSHLAVGDEAGVISMGMGYGLLTFVREADGFAVRTVLGKQSFGKIFVEKTEETCQEIGRISLDEYDGGCASGKQISGENTLCGPVKVLVRYDVKRVGTRDLSEKETGFPLEEVTLSYCVCGGDVADDVDIEAEVEVDTGTGTGVEADQTSYKKALSMAAIPGRWVGVKNGVFCTSSQKNSDGYMEVRGVKYAF